MRNWLGVPLSYILKFGPCTFVPPCTWAERKKTLFLASEGSCDADRFVICSLKIVLRVNVVTLYWHAHLQHMTPSKLGQGIVICKCDVTRGLKESLKMSKASTQGRNDYIFCYCYSKTMIFLCDFITLNTITVVTVVKKKLKKIKVSGFCLFVVVADVNVIWNGCGKNWYVLLLKVMRH